MSKGYTPTRSEVFTALVTFRAMPGGVNALELIRNLPNEEVFEILAESSQGLAEIERAAAEKAYDLAVLHEETKWAHTFDGHPSEEGEICEECDSLKNPYRKEEK